MQHSDVHLKSGTTIPAGAALVVPVRLVQMDSSCWGNDATEFNPYRFLSTVQKESDSSELAGITFHWLQTVVFLSLSTMLSLM